MKYRYIKSNVRVSYESPDKLHAQAYLQYRVKMWGLFNRWVTVNSSYYTDCYYNSLTPDQIFTTLKREGQQFKSVKLNNRNFSKQI